jgi:demethylmenaquinone methyltransferase / 2-methoxy-6-polyprenyl-1,4-benzoquinol methylase
MSEEINSMFSSIHKNYDFMNTTLSLGVDKIWRKRTAKETIIPQKNYKILDIACGTGELAIAIQKLAQENQKEIQLTGVDFNKDMLGIAKKKVQKLNLKIKFETGDALKLKFPNGSFEVVTSGFALRDFDDLGKFVKETYRVLKPKGRLVLIDMSKPDKGLMKYLFKIYFNIMLLEGRLVNKQAYSFLVSSIKKFDKNKLLKLLEKQGYKDIKITEMPFNAAFLVSANK